MFQKILLSIFLLTLFVPVSASASLFGDPVATHVGENSQFEYWVEYINPLGVTTVDENGITYDPFQFSPTHENTFLPEQYFGDYALYFTNSPVTFKVHIKNASKRSFKNLLIMAQQELLNPEGTSGIPFPEPNSSSWFVETLGPSEEIVLEDTFSISGLLSSGIDQTHLQIIHLDNSKKEKRSGRGRILLDDPQAGLWCPLGE